MARFHAYRVPGIAGYLLVVQADLLDHIATRVVVPLVPDVEALRPERRLNPVIAIDGTDHVLMPQQMGSVPASVLKNTAADLSHEAERVTAAVDFLMQGF